MRSARVVLIAVCTLSLMSVGSGARAQTVHSDLSRTVTAASWGQGMLTDGTNYTVYPMVWLEPGTPTGGLQVHADLSRSLDCEPSEHSGGEAPVEWITMFGEGEGVVTTGRDLSWVRASGTLDVEAFVSNGCAGAHEADPRTAVPFALEMTATGPRERSLVRAVSQDFGRHASAFHHRQLTREVAGTFTLDGRSYPVTGSMWDAVALMRNPLDGDGEGPAR